jgi:hypothetical protein
MMKKLLLVAGMLLSWSASALGQGPLNLNMKRVPPDFFGHNSVYLCRLVESRATTKSKYESTKKYLARVAGQDKKPLYGNVYKSSLLGFMVRPNWTDYNADTQVFKGNFTWTADSENTFVRTLQTVKIAQGSYDAQNSFGAGVKVYYDRFSTYGIRITNGKISQLQDTDKPGISRLTFSAKVPPQSAKNLEKNVRVLYVGYIAAPLLTKETQYEGPTFDGPYSRTDYFIYLGFRLKAVWFLDEKTGFIFKKISV